MRHLRNAGLAVMALTMLVATAEAQRQPARQRSAPAQQGGFWELGTDIRLSLGLDDPRSFVIAIPAGNLRAGYYFTNQVSFEPSLTWISVAQENQEGASAYVVGLSVLYHTDPNRARRQVYMRPALLISGGSGGIRSRTGLGFGVGLKRPMFTNRLASRGELNVTHVLESGPQPAETSLNFLLGFSVYTR